MLDVEGDFAKRCNLEMVLLENVEEQVEMEQLRMMISRHILYTDSTIGRKVLDHWNEMLPKFVRVIPSDYKRMLEQIRKVEDEGLRGDEALLAAFEANTRELARTSH
ncbi:Ferredoxin-dependent glutamate synthase 1 [compost metagenome]